jgi:uncharacterized protein (DUF488 family)
MLYTIGHSTHSFETFFALLERFQIQVLCDVRSSPYSRYAPHFAREVLNVQVVQRGLKYLYLGDVLGGIPLEGDFYDLQGRVDYAKVAQSEGFLAGLERVKRGVAQYRIALMCAEENPQGCHRRHLISHALRDTLEIAHIRATGSLELERDLHRLEQVRLF